MTTFTGIDKSCFAFYIVPNLGKFQIDWTILKL